MKINKIKDMIGKNIKVDVKSCGLIFHLHGYLYNKYEWIFPPRNTYGLDFFNIINERLKNDK